MDHQNQFDRTKKIGQSAMGIFQGCRANSEINFFKVNEKYQNVGVNEIGKEKIVLQKQFHDLNQVKSQKYPPNIIGKTFSTGDSYVDKYIRNNEKESLSLQNYKLCENILQMLTNHVLSLAFRLPVDPYSEGIPDYYEVIKRPMDLQTIRLKLNRGRYGKVDQFYKDIELIITNSLYYNRTNQEFIHVTRQFEKYFNKIQRKYDSKNSKSKPIKLKIVKKEPNQKEIINNSKDCFKINLQSTIDSEKNLNEQETFISNELTKQRNIFIDKQTQQISFDSTKIVNESRSLYQVPNMNIEVYFAL